MHRYENQNDRVHVVGGLKSKPSDTSPHRVRIHVNQTLGGAKVIGPLLIGLGAAIEIAPLRSSTSDILNLASVAAYSAGVIDYKKKN